MAEQTEDVKLPGVPEPRKSFRIYADRDYFEVRNADIDEPLVVITGYELDISFNLKYLKSVQDIEAARNGIADLFRDLILQAIMKDKNKDDEGKQ